MKTATWNIKGVRCRKGRLLDWLRAQKPDLVALQKIVTQERDGDVKIYVSGRLGS